MSDYADSLRQQAAWIRSSLDPTTPAEDRLGLDDVDLDELEAAADEIDRLEEKARKVRHKHVHEINIELPWWLEIAGGLGILALIGYLWK
jgi:hypothetical protein